MKILLVPRRGLEQVVKRITRDFEELKVSFDLRQNPETRDFEGADVVIVVGGDGDVLRVLHQMGSESVPALGVNESDESSFLTDVRVSDFRAALSKLVKSDYNIEEADRLHVRIDDKELPPALNEVGIFPSRSATLMEYQLRVDGEPLWRDCADGLIVSTPTGATAYAMSAGGPVVHSKAHVFLIVPVNSIDVTRRPLVVSSESSISVGEISSKFECEAVIDGTFRAKVKNGVNVSRMPKPAKLVRIPEASPTLDRMVKKVRIAEELLKMPPSAKLILRTLEYEGPLSQKDLAKKTMLPERTTRVALSLLVEKRLVRRQQLLRDARHKVYQLA